MRLFTASLATETNSFAPMPTGMQAFRDGWFYPAGQHPDEPTLFAGPLWAARLRGRERGWTVVEGLVAAAYPAGMTTRPAYESLRDEILGQLQAAVPVDIVALGLHGAMVADGYPDCEGDLLSRVREIVGPDTIVGATLDPHGNLSEQMVRAADLLILWKENPHTDANDRAIELIDRLEQQLAGKIRPVASLVDCEMVAPIFTTMEPARSLVARMKEMEQRSGVLSVSLNHGFPFADVPDMGTKVLVYADGDPALAERTARELADEVIRVRDRLMIHRPGIDESLDLALACATPPVVIADSADNAGGGAASDSTWFLRRMLERGIGNAALGALWDPVAVGIAFNAGEGARLKLRLGGKVGPLSGDPLDVDALVRCLRRDHTMQGMSEGAPFDCGDSALLEVNGVDVVVTSKRLQPMGTDLFTGLGCDLASKRIIVVKSTQHFYAHFSKVAGEVIYAEAPGSVSMDFDQLPYRSIRLPRWPIGLQSGKAVAAEADSPLDGAHR